MGHLKWIRLGPGKQRYLRIEDVILSRLSPSGLSKVLDATVMNIKDEVMKSETSENLKK